MRINYQILCVALILCIGFLLFEKKEQVNSSEAVIENILSRTSIRSYTDEKISDEQLTELVRAGMAAPTAGNMQPWEFVVVTDAELLKKMGAVHKFSSPVSSAAAAIVVMANMDMYKDREDFKGFWITDTSAATENILLAANSFGLGAVWLSVYPWDDRDDKIRNILDIDDNFKVLCMIALGHPEGEVMPKDKFKPERIHWKK